ncbi:ATP-dependent DNA helicase RecG [Algiphilus sp.]|uniref:ATP-dependent DNA helicase RecG n=1 Tax=Algiphilus sp. TaxID=1872431 RepID=UPI002A5E4FAB|nr:ATP-dependent DNA helicase RecG [Pseudomonadota bacterium]
MATLDAAVVELPGVGKALAGKLASLGIERIADLVLHLPLRYEDRSRLQRVAMLRHNATAQLALRVCDADTRPGPRRQLRVHCEDAEGQALLLRFFHFRNTQVGGFQPGVGVRVFGTARATPAGWEIVHPEYRLFPAIDAVRAEGVLAPVYPLTAGITQARIRTLVDKALSCAASDPRWAESPSALAAPSTLEALQCLHQPRNADEAAAMEAGQHAAQRRLAKEELLAHQLSLRMVKQRARQFRAPAIEGVRQARLVLAERLGFALTGAQERVIDEIGKDLASAQPMVRLVQGDVGSGKTVVAAAAMLAAARAGWQSAMMAPTELLAEQHARTLADWLAPLGVNVVLLTGRQSKAERSDSQSRLAGGQVQVAVGTHALFQSDTAFHALGLVVVDEQHRFGVRQRLALRDKAAPDCRPHQLVMTATPIPRTLAQTAYADLDLSVIDELPPGRTPVVTAAVSNTRREAVVERLREALAHGRQAYWVCTLIEDSEQLAAQAAEEAAELLQASLPAVRIGLAHGRMKANEKQAVMRAFKAGELQVLVATTVIEVGVDVPNASIMVIENAERLGLSQLHQLRGRVGRGHTESQCLLMYQPPLGEAARERLDVMRRTHSGFDIAEKDLALRGPGELLGRRQTGVVGLKVADPVRDADLLPEMITLAEALLANDAEQAMIHRLVARWVGDVQRYGQV